MKRPRYRQLYLDAKAQLEDCRWRLRAAERSLERMLPFGKQVLDSLDGHWRDGQYRLLPHEYEALQLVMRANARFSAGVALSPTPVLMVDGTVVVEETP